MPAVRAVKAATSARPQRAWRALRGEVGACGTGAARCGEGWECARPSQTSMKTSAYKSSTRFGPWLVRHSSWPNNCPHGAESLSGKSGPSREGRGGPTGDVSRSRMTGFHHDASCLRHAPCQAARPAPSQPRSLTCARGIWALPGTMSLATKGLRAGFKISLWRGGCTAWWKLARFRPRAAERR
jgi:hypothetical protein